ncbi:MAG: hypothetical protein ACMZ63_06355 [Methylotenera sp.]
MLPFTGMMPVIQTTTLAERLGFYFSLLVTFVILIRMFALEEGAIKAKKMVKENLKGLVFALLLFVYGNAQWGANTFGILIMNLPNRLYENTVVLNSKDQEVPDYYTRKQSIVLTFQDNKINKLSTIELSRTLFQYPYEPSPQSGDTLILKGKENLFGVYVEELSVYPKNVNTNPYTLTITDGDYIFVLPIIFILVLILSLYFLTAELKSIE